MPLVGNLDEPATLARLSGLADAVLHLAPPARHGERDQRTAHLLQALMRRRLKLRCLVYGSTSGVYGDCGGAWVDETQSPKPQTERAHRRLDAERRVRWFGRACHIRTVVLRIPGIYGVDRPGGHPRERLARGTPVLESSHDPFTNHIEADDLARACIAALHRGLPQRVVNVNDDTVMTMGDYFDFAADLEGVERPARVSWAQAQSAMSPMQLSFMGESRRLVNRRMKRELRLKLCYPTVREGLLQPPR